MSNAIDESTGSKLTYESVDELLAAGRIDEKTADLLDGLVVKYGGQLPRPPKCPQDSGEEPGPRLTRELVQVCLEEEQIDQKTADLMFDLVDNLEGRSPTSGESS